MRIPAAQACSKSSSTRPSAAPGSCSRPAVRKAPTRRSGFREERERRPFYACRANFAGLKFAEALQREGGSNPESRVKLWIASRSLASGADPRDPLVRNDGLKLIAESYMTQKIKPSS